MPSLSDQYDRDVVVIGGGGHVGLPLAIAFADRGARVGIYDVSQSAVAMVNAGQMPFAEPGAEEVLHRVLAAGRLEASADPAIVGTAEHVVVVIGTPVDEHLNPDQMAISRALGGCSQYLRDGQLLVLRSTVFPGVTRMVERLVGRARARSIDVAFCPERIAEGKAMEELLDAAADRVGPHRPRRDASARRALRPARPKTIVRVATGRGRAGQAVHQLVPLHQVRRSQSAVHDGQRLRPRLRADPAGGDRGLSPGGRSSRPGIRRRTVPAQGHHAAGRVQQQQLRARPGQHADQRGSAPVPRVRMAARIRPATR